MDSSLMFQPAGPRRGQPCTINISDLHLTRNISYGCEPTPPQSAKSQRRGSLFSDVQSNGVSDGALTPALLTSDDHANFSYAFRPAGYEHGPSSYLSNVDTHQQTTSQFDTSMLEYDGHNHNHMQMHDSRSLSAHAFYDHGSQHMNASTCSTVASHNNSMAVDPYGHPCYTPGTVDSHDLQNLVLGSRLVSMAECAPSSFTSSSANDPLTPVSPDVSINLGTISPAEAMYSDLQNSGASLQSPHNWDYSYPFVNHDVAIDTSDAVRTSFVSSQDLNESRDYLPSVSPSRNRSGHNTHRRATQIKREPGSRSSRLTRPAGVRRGGRQSRSMVKREDGDDEEETHGAKYEISDRNGNIIPIDKASHRLEDGRVKADNPPKVYPCNTLNLKKVMCTASFDNQHHLTRHRSQGEHVEEVQWPCPFDPQCNIPKSAGGKGYRGQRKDNFVQHFTTHAIGYYPESGKKTRNIPQGGAQPPDELAAILLAGYRGHSYETLLGMLKSVNRELCNEKKLGLWHGKDKVYFSVLANNARG